jgi:hypothetical protein
MLWLDALLCFAYRFQSLASSFACWIPVFARSLLGDLEERHGGKVCNCAITKVRNATTLQLTHSVPMTSSAPSRTSTYSGATYQVKVMSTWRKVLDAPLTFNQQQITPYKMKACRLSFDLPLKVILSF